MSKGYIVSGMKTGIIYATCHYKSECLRKLKEQHPTFRTHDRFVNKGIGVKNIYPEPLIISKNK